MEYKINLAKECEKWVLSLNEKEQVDVFVVIKLLEE
jgi:hypothetical protein